MESQPRGTLNFVGIGLAALIPGPVVLLSFGLEKFLSTPRPYLPADFTQPPLVPWVLGLAMVAATGWVVAFPVAAVCAMILTRLGERRPGFRLPALWVLIGVLLAGLAPFYVEEQWNFHVAIFSLSGALVAALARGAAAWPPEDQNGRRQAGARHPSAADEPR
jgi:hypothetical protein